MAHWVKDITTTIMRKLKYEIISKFYLCQIICNIRFPWDYSASEYGWKDNFNPATAFIDFMCWCGLAYDRRMPSRETIRKRIERTGDAKELEEKRSRFSYWFDLSMGLFTIFWLVWFGNGLRFIVNCFR